MESLASIRKSCKVPKVARLTSAEAHQRIRPPPSAVPKRAPKPVDQNGELWTRFYKAALLYGHDDPEKMADTSVRALERAKALEAARPVVKRTTGPPKPQETCVNEKAPRKGRVIPHEAFRCKALTLEGRRCGFKSVCGDFCKKHAQKM